MSENSHVPPVSKLHSSDGNDVKQIVLDFPKFQMASQICCSLSHAQQKYTTKMSFALVHVDRLCDNDEHISDYESSTMVTRILC